MPNPTPSDIKTFPAYTLAEAARYVGVSESTMRSWFRGRPAASTKDGGFKRDRVKPILPTEAGAREPLSFIDLIEAHVLFSLRKAYHFPMQKVKLAMEYLARENIGNLMLLAHKDFFHDRGNLYLDFEGKLLTLSEGGQMADKSILSKGLEQITYGNDGFADQFYPKVGVYQDQRELVVNPQINYGHISIVRLGIGTETLARRFSAGEKMSDIAEDYGATNEEIEEAIRWHAKLAA